MAKPFTALAVLIFTVVSLVHLYRALGGAISVVALGYAIPVWVSWPAFVISGLVALMLLRESRR